MLDSVLRGILLEHNTKRTRTRFARMCLSTCLLCTEKNLKKHFGVRSVPNPLPAQLLESGLP